jgi:MFS family permease
LADRYGNKPAFMTGLGIFSLASLGCALSSNLWVIVGLRALQAVGAAALVPTSLGLILTAIAADRRELSIRWWAVSGSLGAAAGPVIGGLLVEVSWRWIFVLNVPIGIAALLATAALMPDIRNARERGVPDLLGGVLLIVAIGALALALVQGPDWGWGSARALTTFAVSAIALVLFLVRSAHHPEPVIDLALLRDPPYAWANIAMFLVSIAFAAQLLGLVLWMQEGWGWTALHTGLAIAPGPLMVSVTALGLRRFTASYPARYVAAFGVVMMGAGGVLIGLSIGVDARYVTEVLPGWLIVGAGVGFAMPTIVAAATAELAPDQTSTGSAILQMGRQIGSVLGVAALVVIVGTFSAPADAIGEFRDVWWMTGLFALLAALATFGIRPRTRGRGVPVAAVESAEAGALT